MATKIFYISNWWHLKDSASDMRTQNRLLDEFGRRRGVSSVGYATSDEQTGVFNLQMRRHPCAARRAW